MRTIEWTRTFKRDYKRVLATPRHREISPLLQAVGEQLAQNQSLAQQLRDHPLSGSYTNHRECHLKPDLLLIYKKPNPQTLVFVRLGSHSELF